MKRIFAAVVVLLLIGGCIYVYRSSDLNFLSSAQVDLSLDFTPSSDDEPQGPDLEDWEQTVLPLLESMTLEEKVGQLFFARCPEINGAKKVTEYRLGGYLLFGRDFQDKTAQQVIDSIGVYQAAARIPLLIGTDEEGGTVVRASANPNLFATRCLSPQALYAQGGLEAIAADAKTKSSTLLSLGVNVNFAPVADVSTDPDDFIYDRSFGQDAKATAEYVKTVVAAMESVRFQKTDGRSLAIGSVLKHFPGYGNNADTHTGIAVDERPYETFTSSDFLPFEAGIDAGAHCVLVSHNIVNCMDDSLPASLSPEVHRILREELGFEGVVITDDLAMDAIDAYAKDGSAAVLAVLAGNDMIVTTDFETQIPQVLAAVEDGTISEDLINQAVTRILHWKYNLGLLEQ